MPKVDRALQQKKDSQASRKRLVAQNAADARVRAKEQKEAEAEEWQRQVEAAEAKARVRESRGDAALRQGEAKTTFAGMAKVTRLESERSEVNEEEEAEYENAAPEYKPQAVKKETNADRKRNQAARHLDEIQLLAEEEKIARRQRIIGRFLRMLLVGYIIEAYQSRDPKPASKQAQQKDGKSKKKGGSINGAKNSSKLSDSGLSMDKLQEKVSNWAGPFLMLLFTCLLFGARIAGEDFAPDEGGHDVNLYDVLGTSADAGMLEIRKAYKNLALSWHPDKNPGCEVCAEKFAKISKAYDTLTNPEKRKAYDARRAPEGSLDSVASVDLTAEDFEARVKRSNEVWYVQVYDPNEGLCKHFHPVWEDVASTNQGIARFGRIDIVRNRAALSHFPQRVAMMPVVFRFARGHQPEIFQWQPQFEQEGSSHLARFVQDHYPEAPRFDRGAQLSDWWNESGSQMRILISSSGTGPMRGGNVKDFRQVHRAAHIWAEFFSFGLASSKIVRETLGRDMVPGTDAKAWSVAVKTGSGADSHVEIIPVDDVKNLHAVLQEVTSRTVSRQAPHLTVRNHHQLCEAPAMRTFCLVLVDADDGKATKALKELQDSHAAFEKELHEIRSEDEEATEEPFHIQPVRVMTSSSRLPWEPVAAGAAFASVLAAVGNAQAFVIEVETRRVAAVRTTSYAELYQQIAYDDLTLKELPEGVSFARGLPDSEVSLRRELSVMLSSLWGSVLAFLLVAVVFAVAPELSLATGGAAAAALVAVVLAVWPTAGRRFLTHATCTMSSANFYCRVLH